VPGLTSIEIATIDAMVCVFESERPGDYSAIASSATDNGGLSYGKHQAALVPGSLFKMLDSYRKTPGAQFASALDPYMEDLQKANRALDRNGELQDLLRRAANDPAMKKCQDEFFAENYMGPALAQWRELGFQLPLTAGLIYDTFVQSGSGRFPEMRARAEATGIRPSAETEKAWAEAYVQGRKSWLATRASRDTQNSIVRMQTFEELIRIDNWKLALPIRLQRPRSATYPLTPWDLGDHLYPGDVSLRRGGSAGFGVAKAGDASGPNGRDRFVQTCLIDLGLLTGAADGRFGAGTTRAVKEFQRQHGLQQTGNIGAGDFDRLCEEIEAKQNRSRIGRASDGFAQMPPTRPSGEAKVLGAAGAGAVIGAGSVALGGVAGDAGDDAESAVIAEPSPAATASLAPSPSTAPAPGQTAAPSASPAPAATASAAPAPKPTTASVGVPQKVYHFPFGDVPSSYVAVGLGASVVAAVVLLALALRKSY
jgi:peptidoglycan hydrolase-like protein with peptidoglycan-binding domain